MTTGNKRERDVFLEELKKTKNQDSLRQIKQRDEVDSMRPFAQGYSVIPFRDSLLLIYTWQSSFLTKERAATISLRIDRLTDEYPFSGIL